MYNNIDEVKVALISQHFKEHYGELVKRARFRLGDFYAEDAVMDAYERALKYRDNLNLEIVDIVPYMSIILGNTIKDYQRGNVPKVEVAEDMILTTILEEDHESLITLKRVEEKMMTLPENKRGIVYMYLFQGESGRDVSKVFNTPMGVVRNICCDFRKEVREELGYEL